MGGYNSFYLQIFLFVLLATVLLISAVSLFIKPAKRTIRASLVDSSTGYIIDISQAETSIGRAKSCDISLSEMSVSRFHAVLSRRSSGWMIFDTNSTSGVSVNGKKIDKKTYLSDGDKIKIGKCEFSFYSTAVTTHQQIVPKTKVQENDRRRYKKVSENTNTRKIRQSDSNKRS